MKRNIRKDISLLACMVILCMIIIAAIYLVTPAHAASNPLLVGETRYFPISGTAAGETWTVTALKDGSAYAGISGVVSVADNGSGKYTAAFTPTLAADYDITFTSGEDTAEWLESVVAHGFTNISGAVQRNAVAVTAIPTTLSSVHGSGTWSANNYGTGDTLVNENTGGTGALLAYYNGHAKGGIRITAYLTSDYILGHTSSVYNKGQTYSKDDGTWINGLYLSAGLHYTIVFSFNNSATSTTVTP